MNEADFYRRQSPVSDPRSDCFGVLPSDPGRLREIVHQLIAHRDHLPRLGIELPPERKNEAEARYVSAIVNVIRTLNDAPLAVERPLVERFAGTCRNFAIMLCAMLRHMGVPARLRCGFAGYFVAGFHDDHWVSEYWSADKGWRLADAQITAAHAAFDPVDVPRDEFIVAGAAWRSARAGTLDADTFGVYAAGHRGLGEIGGNVIRDLAALNKIETLPWDDWGMAERLYAGRLSDDDMALMDRAAAMSADGGPVDSVRALLHDNPDLAPPTELARLMA